MPTYTNGTSNVVFIENSQGDLEELKPGKTMETVYFCDHETLGLTMDSETPYYEREVSDDVLTGLSSSPQAVTVDPATRLVLILQITDMVTVHRNHDGSVPLLRDHQKSDGIFMFESDTRTKRFLVTGSGSCRVLQLRND